MDAGHFGHCPPSTATGAFPCALLSVKPIDVSIVVLGRAKDPSLERVALSWVWKKEIKMDRDDAGSLDSWLSRPFWQEQAVK